MSKHPKSFTGLFPTHRPPNSIHNIVAQALQENNGSLVSVPSGHLIRIASSAEAWDLGQEWVGREITGWTRRASLWDKSIKVSFNARLNSENAYLPLFYLSLDPSLTDEEVKLSADTYMMVLNMRRKDMGDGNN